MSQGEMEDTIRKLDRQASATTKELQRLTEELRERTLDARRYTDQRCDDQRDDFRSLARIVATIHDRVDRLLGILERWNGEPGKRVVH